MIPDFSLFSRDDGQSTLKHVVRFTVQCGKLANYENFYHFKLRLFPNSLTKVAFTWYTTLPRNSIQSWQEMERQFHTQFFKAEPEVSIVELSRVTQRNGETTFFFFYLMFQEDEKQMQDPSSRDRVRENGPKRFTH